MGKKVRDGEPAQDLFDPGNMDYKGITLVRFLRIRQDASLKERKDYDE